jgi:nitrogen regulatory protein PII-like uncharacterized protein
MDRVSKGETDEHSEVSGSEHLEKANKAMRDHCQKAISICLI